MKTGQSFAEKLRLKRQEEDGEKQVQEDRRQKEIQEERKRKEQIEKAYKDLVAFGQKKIVPILNTINVEYLKGGGKVTYSPTLAFYYDRCYYAIGDNVTWEIGWGWGEHTVSGSYDNDVTFYWGNKISLKLWPDGKVKVYAGRDKEDKEALNENEPLNINNPLDLAKVEDLIFNAINSGSCYYSD